MATTIRQFLVSCILLIVGACAACSTTPQPHPIVIPDPAATDIEKATIDRALDANVTLYRVDSDGTARLICSAVRVSPTRIVTAYHCALAALLPKEVLDLVRVMDPLMRHTEVDGLIGQHMWYTWRYGAEPYKARLLGVDMRNDLAILATPPATQPSAAGVRSTRGQVGESVFSIGNPLGYEDSFTRGWISNSCRTVEADDHKECWTQADITDAPGSSGGGLFDATGNLMGICSWGPKGVMLSFFADPVALSNFIEAYAY